MADAMFEARLGQRQLTGAPLKPLVAPATAAYESMDDKLRRIGASGRKSGLRGGRVNDVNVSGAPVRFNSPPPPPAASDNPADWPAKTLTAESFTSGGDGTVAREAPIRDRSVTIGGGLPREELLRRMENASITMRGSPTARAAMMGVYGDSLKALDQVGVDNNQNNGRNDQIAYQAGAQANMQEAAGRQTFGNEVGLMNRKMAAERALAAATADPEKRALELAKLRAETANLGSKGAIDAAKYDATAQETADKAINARAAQLAGGSNDPAIVAAAANQAARERITLMGDTTSAASKNVLSSDARGIGETLGAWKRLGGFWTDNSTRPIPAGAVIDPSDVTTDYGDAKDDNNFNDWFGGLPWVEKDRRVVYTNPQTGEKHTQWLDPGEKADKNILDAVDAYNTPAYRQKVQEERRRLGQPRK